MNAYCKKIEDIYFYASREELKRFWDILIRKSLFMVIQLRFFGIAKRIQSIRSPEKKIVSKVQILSRVYYIKRVERVHPYLI